MRDATVITIDGAAASGKSTVARRVAEKLGYTYLDTGATFRALTLVALQEGTNLTDEDALLALAKRTIIRLEPTKEIFRVFANGNDITEEIRSPEITANVGALAVSGKIRKHLVALWRDFAKGKQIVAEGRDQGTNAFPEAKNKFFLIANLEERAKRRRLEFQSKGSNISQEEVERRVKARDDADTQREVAPLVWQPQDATVIDTTNLTIDEAVERIVSSVLGEAK